MNADKLTGTVIRYQSGFYQVALPDGRVTVCQLRGRLKRGPARGDLAAVGEEVDVSLQADGTGMIETIHPRRSELARLAPTPRGPYRQVLVANLDQVALVFACAHPAPHLRMLDRFLVICEKQRLQPLIIVNKVDLLPLDEVQAMFAIYPPLGYRVLFASARAGIGIDELHSQLSGRISGFAGPSGVGKSSLLNAVQPELGLAVSEIGREGQKGRHTTVVREMYALNGGGFLIDLPGLRSLALWDTQPEELDGYFPELRDRVADCAFNDCTHTHEPGCAVIAAVDAGQVHPERYESYLRLRFGDD